MAMLSFRFVSDTLPIEVRNMSSEHLQWKARSLVCTIPLRIAAAALAFLLRPDFKSVSWLHSLPGMLELRLRTANDVSTRTSIRFFVVKAMRAHLSPVQVKC